MNNPFILSSSMEFYVQDKNSIPLSLAAQDLAQDIFAVTGGLTETKIIPAPPAVNGIIIRIIPEEFPSNAIENYRLHSEKGNLLFIDGSDTRGTIYGIYAFSSDFLHVSPSFLWSQLPIRRLDNPCWPDIQRSVGNPAIRYRGVFINDEDLLTGWEIGGPRHTSYRYYHTVISRNTVRRVASTLLRMGYNLAIPASFVDIRNSEEEMLLEEFSNRGFILTMHHVEPLGVSAFGFDNYWQARGESHSFSYFSEPDALREVWRDSIRRWTKYPEVIWQLGLRGRGDKPFWEAGAAPEGDAERAAVISNAIREQQQMVWDITGDKNAVFSTTLWGEGSLFSLMGLLDIPPKVITVFSDNCAGWRLQDDFFLSPNQPGAAYGIYSHHAIIVGTHLAQAIGVRDYYKLLTTAMATRKLQYAIFNASNIREFIYGLTATAKITLNPDDFIPETFLERWVHEHFSTNQKEIQQCYIDYFDSYEKNSRGIAVCNDGLLFSRSIRALNAILSGNRESSKGNTSKGIFLDSLSDMFPDTSDTDAHLILLQSQEESMARVQKKCLELQPTLPPSEAGFLYAQLTYPATLNRCFCRCEHECLQALCSFQNGDDDAIPNHLLAAQEALKEYEAAIPEYLSGEFRHWYDGCVKIDYRQVLKILEQLLENKR